MDNNSSTVNKAIDILDIFLQKDGEIGLTEISRLTNCDISTVYRLASTLKKRKFLYQAKRNGKYTLGLKMIDFSMAMRRNMRFIDLAYLYLGKINMALNAAVNLAILDVDKSLMIEEIAISSKGTTYSSLNPRRIPLYSTACGKVLLAYMPKADRKAYYATHSLQSYTPKTVTNVNELEEELSKILEEGVAFDMENHRIGVFAIAVPIFNGNGNLIASASIILPENNTDSESIEKFANAMKKCGEDLSKAIGEIS